MCPLFRDDPSLLRVQFHGYSLEQTPPVSLTLNHLPFQGRQEHFVPAGHKDGDAYNIIYKLFTHAIVVDFP